MTNILHIVNTAIISLYQLLVDPVGLCGGRALVVCEVCVLNSIQDIRKMGREKAWLTFVHHLLTAGLCLFFLTYILINSQSTLSEWELRYVFIPLQLQNISSWSVFPPLGQRAK